MIINYGAFVSRTLDKNYLPLLLKYLELYTLTYSLDSVLSELSNNSNRRFVRSGSRRSFKIVAESENGMHDGKEIIEIDSIGVISEEELLMEQSKNPSVSPGLPATTTHPPATATQGRNQGNTQGRNQGQRSTTRTYANPRANAGTGNAPRTNTAPRQPPVTVAVNTSNEPREQTPETDIGQLDRGVISVEPTWIKVTYGDQVFIFGIKVLPVYVRNDDILIKQLMADTKNRTTALLTKGLSRSVRRFGNRLYNRTIGRLPFLGADVPSGIRVGTQVVIASSSMKNNVYIVLNKNNIDSEFLNDSESISNMHRYLGWCSMLFVDDVNQHAYFCMKPNHGTCNMIPYRVLMYAAGKNTSKGYQEIDEIQNAVTSVFSTNKKKFTKILGEMKAATKVIDVQQYLNEVMLFENTSKYLSNPDLAIDMFKKIRFISKMSNIDEIRKKLIGFPTETIDSITPFINKNSDNFMKMVNFTRKVLKNSMPNDVNKEDIELVSYILSYRNSNMRGPNQMIRLRDTLKMFIVIYRNNKRQKLEPKVNMFRTIVEVFNTYTSILQYHDLGDDKQRQDILLKNLYVFLSLVPNIVNENI